LKKVAKNSSKDSMQSATAASNPSPFPLPVLIMLRRVWIIATMRLPKAIEPNEVVVALLKEAQVG
jgi:hypothetical protein